MKNNDDKEAKEYLTKSYNEIQNQVNRIVNSDFQRSFLNIDLHQKIITAFNKT